MKPALKKRLRRVALHLQWLAEAAAIYLVMGLCRLLGQERASNFGGWVARQLGPRVGASRIGRRQLAMIFPEKSEVEREEILVGSWDNLGRYFTEYVHLAGIWPDRPEGPQPGDAVEINAETYQRFLDLRDDGAPALLFTGHIGNWELLAVGAARYDLKMTSIFRRPNNPIAEKLLLGIRGSSMGDLLPASFQAALTAARVLEQGEHLGMLVDQHFSRGVQVPFLGCPAYTSVTLARLARRFKCPVHGAWVERIGGTRFRIHVTPPLDLEEDYADEDETRAVRSITAKATAEVETWVRSRPELWNWMHRRWR